MIWVINQVVLVGKIKGIEKDDKYKGNLYIEIERPFKDSYQREFDVIECSFWESLFKRIINNCKNWITTMNVAIENTTYTIAKNNACAKEFLQKIIIIWINWHIASAHHAKSVEQSNMNKIIEIATQIGQE